MKNNRQAKIIELINENVILTQEDLQSALQSIGFNITQSTVSRDIKELRLVKGHDSSGNYRYLSADSQKAVNQPVGHYKEIFSRSVKSVDYAMNDVVIKCYNGMASGACVALDIMFGDKMLGSLAGDDTIFVITRSENEAALLADELKKIL